MEAFIHVVRNPLLHALNYNNLMHAIARFLNKLLHDLTLMNTLSST